LFKKQYKPDDQKSLKKQDNINDMNIVWYKFIVT
jgi:hypothetical protein